jgi:hypothetical protein
MGVAWRWAGITKKKYHNSLGTMRELGKNLLDQRNIMIVEKNVFLTVRQEVLILPIILSWYEHYFRIIQKIIKLTTSIVSL